MDYDKENKKIFTGDQFGYIHCYNIKGIFDILSSGEINQDSIKKLDEFNIICGFKLGKINFLIVSLCA